LLLQGGLVAESVLDCCSRFTSCRVSLQVNRMVRYSTVTSDFGKRAKGVEWSGVASGLACIRCCRKVLLVCWRLLLVFQYRKEQIRKCFILVTFLGCVVVLSTMSKCCMNLGMTLTCRAFPFSTGIFKVHFVGCVFG
jgi:hypothetical protein